MKATTIFFKYDYGIKERGESLEKKVFLPAIKNNFDCVSTFWLEDNGFDSDIMGLQNKILNFCEKQKPDVIFFILMKDEIHLDTLKKLSKEFITINWFCDDQWRFDSFTKNIAPLLSYSVTVDKYSLTKYKDIKCRVLHSQWAAMDYNPDLNLQKIQYKYEISFIGGKNITREWYIYELRKIGLDVQCFGNGWENGRISYDQMKDVFKSSKINLNLSNSTPNDIRFYKYLIKKVFRFNKGENFPTYLKRLKSSIKILLGKNLKNVEQMKARNFEISGFGGFQLSQYCPELDDYYVIGKEIAIFTNLDDLCLNADFYLKNERLREEIREKGHFKTRVHTYDNRLKKIIEEVQNEKSLFSC